MTNPKETIQNDIKVAMKARDKDRVSTLRLLLSSMESERIKTGKPVNEAGFLTLVQRGVKQRREASALYREGDRPELAKKEDAEATILTEYLPEPASEEEVRRAIDAFVTEEGLEGPKAIGRIMGTILPKYKGRIQGKELQRLAREVLAQNSGD